MGIGRDSLKELKVSKIVNGTVIDHIPAGRALQVLKLLGIDGSEGFMVLIAMNVYSKKLRGKKDIVKLEGKYLSDEETRAIALIAPTATINIIKNGDVVEKRGVELPDVVEGILTCPNSSCITRDAREPIKPKFIVVKKRPVKLKCYYCGEVIEEKDVFKHMNLG